MGRDRRAITEALDRLGRPQDTTRTILVAGTNGKGSTAAMIESMVRAAGYRTGFFQSPALGPDQDHILVNGRAIDRECYLEAFFRADRAGELTWFECLTAAAFLTFAAERVDLAVIEVGMGGAHDCTNVMRSTLSSVLVTVDLDHTEHLGPDLSAITREKCGVFRRGRPAHLGFLAPEVEAAARRHARHVGAEPTSCAERLIPVEIQRLPDGGQSMTLSCPQPDRAGPCHGLSVKLPLAGRHQAQNAALAALVCQDVADRYFPRIDREAIHRGLELCRWPGRLEWIHGERPALLDAAHNPAAALALAHYLESRSSGPVDMIFGAFTDKDSIRVLDILRPWIGRLVVTTSGHSRSTAPSLLAQQWRDIGSAQPAIVADSPAHALEIATALGAGPICVTGSVDLVGKVRELLLKPSPKPSPKTQSQTTRSQENRSA